MQTQMAPHGLTAPPDQSVLQTADQLRSAIRTYGLAPIEFEVRIGALDSRKRFLSNVSEAKLDAITKFFELQDGARWVSSQMHTRETCWGGANGRMGAETRRQIVDLLNPSTPPVYIMKRKVAAVDDKGPPATRCSLAVERFVGPLQPPANTTVRVKRRRSFSNGVWRVDLTKVVNGDDDRYTCELEIELEDKTLVFRKTFEAIVADALAIANDLSTMIQG